MTDHSDQPIDPEKYKAMVPTKPGLDEGVTPEVEELRREHQLPDAEVEFESLARHLANMDLDHADFPPTPQWRADEDPGVIEMDKQTEQKFLEQDREVSQAMSTESFGSLHTSLTTLSTSFDSIVSGLQQRFREKNDKASMALLQKVNRIYVEATAATVPLDTVKERFNRGELSPVRYYEVIWRARNEIKKLLAELKSIISK